MSSWNEEGGDQFKLKGNEISEMVRASLSNSYGH